MKQVLISACICQRSSWTPKTQPNGTIRRCLVSFWCSTRFTRKNFAHSPGIYVYPQLAKIHLDILYEKFRFQKSCLKKFVMYRRNSPIKVLEILNSEFFTNRRLCCTPKSDFCIYKSRIFSSTKIGFCHLKKSVFFI